MIISDYLHHDHKISFLQEIIAQAKEKNQSNPAVLSRTDEYVESCQEEQFWKSFAGCPIVIKDNILLQDTVSTFGSQIWWQYRAPYSATVVRKLEEAGFLIVGKTTMDEFAMGTTGENTPFPLPHNPYDERTVAGWSSSGSAVAVAEGMIPVALGTDTGGSVRLPASFCGLVALKPTYGAVSRYGVQAMASSFDQVGVIATTIDDTKSVFDVIKWIDPLDATTRDYVFEQTIQWVQWLRIGLPKQYFWQGLDPQIEDVIMTTIDNLVKQGATIVELDIPLIDAGVSVYYTLVNAEVSTNMARFDGVRFGLQWDTTENKNHHDYIATIRDQGFGSEVKRRILLGAHILSASEYEWLYVKAMNIRTLVTQQFKTHFEHDVDVIMGPTVPLLPRSIGAKVDDPVAMYLADAYTVIANLTGCPALNIPVWYGVQDGKKFPIGMQLIGNHGSEYDLFEIGKKVESRK